MGAEITVYDLPFWVVTTDQETFTASFDTEREANADATHRNMRAGEMGVNANYKAIPRPSEAS